MITDNTPRNKFRFHCCYGAVKLYSDGQKIAITEGTPKLYTHFTSENAQAKKECRELLPQFYFSRMTL